MMTTLGAEFPGTFDPLRGGRGPTSFFEYLVRTKIIVGLNIYNYIKIKQTYASNRERPENNINKG